MVVLWLAAVSVALPIPRVSAPSLQRFFADFADKHMPVIITNYSGPFREMTKSNVLRHCGEVPVPITSTGGEGWAGIITRDDSGYTLAEVAHMVGESGAADSSCSAGAENVPLSDTAIGVFDFSLPQYCASLLEDHFTMPKYLAQDFL